MHHSQRGTTCCPVLFFLSSCSIIAVWIHSFETHDRGTRQMSVMRQTARRQKLSSATCCTVSNSLVCSDLHFSSTGSGRSENFPIRYLRRDKRDGWRRRSAMSLIRDATTNMQGKTSLVARRARTGRKVMSSNGIDLRRPS